MFFDLIGDFIGAAFAQTFTLLFADVFGTLVDTFLSGLAGWFGF